MGRSYRGYELKFYYDERQAFKHLYQSNLSRETVDKVVAFLCNKFRFEIKEIKYREDTGGLAYIGKAKICIPEVPSMGVLIHELAHIYNDQKKISYHHNKRLWLTMEWFENSLKEVGLIP